MGPVPLWMPAPPLDTSPFPTCSMSLPPSWSMTPPALGHLGLIRCFCVRPLLALQPKVDLVPEWRSEWALSLDFSSAQMEQTL